MATGASYWEAIGLVAGASGAAAVEGLWRDWSARERDAQAVVAALDTVADHAPEVADAWLNTWLAGRGRIEGDLILYAHGWITRLPEGFSVEGYLDLDGTAIRALPVGLQVGGNLSVGGCLGLTGLPAGLEVGGSLNMTAYGPSGGPSLPLWDGRIPEDAKARVVVTDRHPLGEGLERWRREYPNGERA
jgi:hypothetical protein